MDYFVTLSYNIITNQMIINDDCDGDQPLYSGDRSSAADVSPLDTFDCLKAFIGLGKCQPRLTFTDDMTSRTKGFDITATDLDFRIILALSDSTDMSADSLCSDDDDDSPDTTSTPDLLLLSLLNKPTNAALLLLLAVEDDESLSVFSPTTISRTNLDLDRNKEETATERDRRMEGSASIRLETRPTEASPRTEKKREKDDVEEEEVDEGVDVTAQGPPQGRRLAQSGQRLLRRSLRHVEQTPLRRRLVGCLGHFHTSSSSTYIIATSIEESYAVGSLVKVSSFSFGCR